MMRAANSVRTGRSSSRSRAGPVIAGRPVLREPLMPLSVTSPPAAARSSESGPPVLPPARSLATVAPTGRAYLEQAVDHEFEPRHAHVPVVARPDNNSTPADEISHITGSVSRCFRPRRRSGTFLVRPSSPYPGKIRAGLNRVARNNPRIRRTRDELALLEPGCVVTAKNSLDSSHRSWIATRRRHDQVVSRIPRRRDGDCV